MTEKTKKSAPAKLDDTQLDAAVGGATFSAVTAGDPCIKVVRTIVPCVKIVKTL